MAMLECSSQSKSDNFSHGRLYGREAIYHIINIMLSQPKGGMYENPWLGFDRHDLLHFSMNSDEHVKMQNEISAMLKQVLSTENEIEVSIKNNDNGDGVDVAINIIDPLGGVETFAHTFNLDPLSNKYKNIKVR